MILNQECLKNCTHIPPSKVAQDHKNNNSISEGISSQCGTFLQSDIYKKLFVDHLKWLVGKFLENKVLIKSYLSKS